MPDGVDAPDVEVIVIAAGRRAVEKVRDNVLNACGDVVLVRMSKQARDDGVKRTQYSVTRSSSALRLCTTARPFVLAQSSEAYVDEFVIGSGPTSRKISAWPRITNRYQSTWNS
jgi:hypothetical protein